MLVVPCLHQPDRPVLDPVPPEIAKVKPVIKPSTVSAENLPGCETIVGVKCGFQKTKKCVPQSPTLLLPPGPTCTGTSIMSEANNLPEENNTQCYLILASNTNLVGVLPHTAML